MMAIKIIGIVVLVLYVASSLYLMRELIRHAQPKYFGLSHLVAFLWPIYFAAEMAGVAFEGIKDLFR